MSNILPEVITLLTQHTYFAELKREQYTKKFQTEAAESETGTTRNHTLYKYLAISMLVEKGQVVVAQFIAERQQQEGESFDLAACNFSLAIINDIASTGGLNLVGGQN